MKPRPEPTRAATLPLRIASPRIRRRGERTVGFEGAQSRGENKVERNTKGGRPLEEAPRGNGGQSGNLPLFLAAHLGRGKNGQPFQSSLTSIYGGQALPNNIGGNLPSNGMFLSHHAQPFIPVRLSIPNRFMPTHIHPYQQPTSYVNGQHLSFPMQTPPAIEETVLKGQRKVSGIITEDKKTKADSPPTGDPIMVYFPICQKVLGNSRYGEGCKKLRATSKDVRKHLRIQIQEAVNSGQLSHLVKGIKKERTKSSDTPRGESKKDKGTAPAEAPILMVNNAPVIIEAKIFGRKVGRVYMDSESSCEIIYEHCFEKLNPTIKATKVDLKTPLVGF
ncbi:hypothetical protein Tco_0492878 [Tanacetum coccineum]